MWVGNTNLFLLDDRFTAVLESGAYRALLAPCLARVKNPSDFVPTRPANHNTDDASETSYTTSIIVPGKTSIQRILESSYC